MEAVSSVMLHQIVIEECKIVFAVGNYYQMADVKVMLQEIYNKAGINATAKANDLPQFMPSAVKRQLTNPANGKRVHYYEIQ